MTLEYEGAYTRGYVCGGDDRKREQGFCKNMTNWKDRKQTDETFRREGKIDFKYYLYYYFLNYQHQLPKPPLHNAGQMTLSYGVECYSTRRRGMTFTLVPQIGRNI